MSAHVQRFTQVWLELGALGNPESVANDLLARWSEPQRHYHTLAHLDHCLASLDHHRSRTAHAPELEAALWFHDAVYDPQAADNELRSAALARDIFTRANVAAQHIDRIEQLILSTRVHVSDGTSDNDLLLDIDLAVLGSTADAYARYAEAIRQEYAWVPEADYREKRAVVLTRFLARPALFLTEPFYQRLETCARQNLITEISLLTATHPHLPVWASG
jgi:predicted metal-dependent HD superfamily phosphohydrolase